MITYPTSRNPKRAANFTQNFHRKILASNRCEKFSSLAAIEGNEVKVLSAGDAFETVWHGNKERPRPTLAKPARVGHPTVARVDATGISYSGILINVRQGNEFERLPHPPISRFDICACKDGSIILKPQASCGKPGQGQPTDRRWK